MQDLPAPKDAARRVRAALAYAGIDVKDTDTKVGISAATMARIVSQAKPRGFQKAGELERVAVACEVPEDFLRHGWALVEPDVSGRLATLESQMQAVLRQLAGAAPPPPPGVGPHQQPSGHSNATTAPPPDSQEELDDRGGTGR